MASSKRQLHRRQTPWALLICLLLLVPLLAACAAPQDQPIKVVATLAPLADWARQVGGDRVQVTQIVPAKTDPTTYTLSEQQRQAIAEADVLILNGYNLEPWLDEISPQTASESLITLDLSQYLGIRDTGTRTVVRTPLEGEGPTRTEAQPVYFPPNIVSPYIWLDPGPSMAQRATILIADTFGRADMDGLMVYRHNAERYNGELENLDNWIRREIRTWPRVRVGAKDLLAMQMTDRDWHYFAQHYTINLRTVATINTFMPTIPAATPLFTDPALSHSEQLRVIGLRKPDGVLDPLSSESYIELMQTNVKIMTEGMQRAAKNEPKQFTFDFSDS
ncbi:MAG: zinc ABC transporter substrate-binding protein [Chloroflexi bacterium]|nr:zinc ABC transporter substrate-binding protein [Chloroflexota bacterium]